MRISRFALLFAWVLAIPAHAAAKVWVVGPGSGADFSTLQSAIDAAASGDLILVKSGFYDRFTIDGKALALQADLDGPIAVGTSPTAGNAMTPHGPQSIVRNVATGAVSLRGLQIAGLEVSDCSAPVLVESCVVSGTAPAVRVSDSDGVAFLRSTLSGPAGFVDSSFSSFGDEGHGLEIERSTVFASDCTVRGGDGRDLSFTMLGTMPSTSGRSGAFLVDSTLLAAGGSFAGGDGGDGGSDGFFCHAGGNGGHGLHLAQGAAFASLREVGLAPGSGGGFTGSCTFGFGGPGVSGVPVQVDSGTVVTPPGPVHEFHATSPVREQQFLDIDYTGHPGATSAILLSATPIVEPFGAASGVLLASPPLVLAIVGSVPATGSVSLHLLVPDLGTGVDGVRVVLQGLLCASGTCVLGSGSVVVALDGSL